MKFLLLITTCLVPLFFYAQAGKVSFKIGDEYDLNHNTDDGWFINTKGNGIVFEAEKDKKNIFIDFDPKLLKATAEKSFEIPPSDQTNLEGYIDLQGRRYWLHSEWDKVNNKESLYYDKVDLQTGKVIEGNHLIIENKKLAGHIYGLNKYIHAHDIENKFTLIKYRFPPVFFRDKVNYDSIGMKVFDANMMEMWSNEYKMPYTEAQMDEMNFILDTKGDAYTIAKIYDKDKNHPYDKKADKPAYHYELLKFSKDTKKISQTTIAMGDYFLNDPRLIETPQHELIMAFTYSKKRVNGSTRGIFLTQIKDGKIIKYKEGYYTFPPEEIKKFEAKRVAKKMDKEDELEVAHLNFNDIIIEENEGLFITFEINYSESYRSGMNVYTDQFSNDIYCMKINGSTNKQEWVRKIPKRQVNKSTAGVMGTVGFKFINTPSGYYFFFLDHKKNMELSEDEEPAYHQDGKGGRLVVAKLDKAGVYSKEFLFDTRDEDVNIFPRRFLQTGNNWLVAKAEVRKTVFKPLLIIVD